MYKLPLCTWVRERPRKNCEKGSYANPLNVSTVNDEKSVGRKTKIMFSVVIVEASTKKTDDNHNSENNNKSH